MSGGLLSGEGLPGKGLMSRGLCSSRVNLSTFIHHIRQRKKLFKTNHKYITTTRCMAMPSLMAARWMGQNSGPIFPRLWTKVNLIKFAYSGMSVVYNAVFRLAMSCFCVPEIFAIKSRSCAKFWWFRQPNSGGKGPPKLLTEVYESGSPSNMWKV